MRLYRTRRTFMLTAFAVLITGCSRQSVDTDEAPQTPTSEASSLSVPQKSLAPIEEVTSPEAVLKQFFIAMLAGDKAGIQQVAIPNDRLDVLISTNQLTPQQIDSMKAQFASMPISRLSVGETVRLPNGKSINYDSSMINDNRQHLTMPGNPLPFDLVKTDGTWKVNAAPIIAARLAAQAAQQGNTDRP